MPGYQFSSSQLNERVTQFCLLRGGHAVSTSAALHTMHTDADFRELLSDTMRGRGYQAARFETPAATRSTLDKPFEFVLVDSPGLSRAADPSSFTKQFETGDPHQSVIVFPNLRGDATMVVPRPIDDGLSYTHLLDFLRCAPRQQAQDLWRSVAGAMLEEISDTPIWLSTAGGGVPWLHVRLDSRPKYYSYQPYTSDPS